MKCTPFLKIHLSAAVLALCIGGSFSSLRGAVVVVDPSMSASIIYGKAATLKPGDMMQFRGGVYPISFYCGINFCFPSGTSTLPVTLASFPGEQAIIKPTSGLRVFNFGQSQAYIILDGLVIDAVGVGYDGIQIEQPAHHIKVRNCEVKNFKSQGINVGPDCNFNEILSTKIHDGGTMSGIAGLNPGQLHAIYFSGKNNLADRCTIYNITGYGVHIYNGYAGKTADRNVAKNCNIQNTGTYKVSGSSTAAGILLSSGSGNQAIGNTLQNNPYNIKIYDGSVGGIAEGNRCSASQNPQDIFITPGSSGAVVKNNCVSPAKVVNQGSGTTLSNNTLTGCEGGGTPPPPPTNVDVTQTQPPISQPPSTSQPSGPTTAGVAMPFLIAGVIGAALLLGSD